MSAHAWTIARLLADYVSCGIEDVTDETGTPVDQLTDEQLTECAVYALDTARGELGELLADDEQALRILRHESATALVGALVAYEVAFARAGFGGGE